MPERVAPRDIPRHACIDWSCVDCENAAAGDVDPEAHCPNSKKECGHHCNHSWSHDSCCWCNGHWGEEPEVPEEQEA